MTQQPHPIPASSPPVATRLRRVAVFSLLCYATLLVVFVSQSQATRSLYWFIRRLLKP